VRKNEKKDYARSRRDWIFVFALVSSCSLAAFDGSCARRRRRRRRRRKGVALALDSHELLRFLHLVESEGECAQTICTLSCTHTTMRQTEYGAWNLVSSAHGALT